LLDGLRKELRDIWLQAENCLMGLERSSEISGYKLAIACWKNKSKELRDIWLHAENRLPGVERSSEILYLATS
jgi:hypothetical protein